MKKYKKNPTKQFVDLYSQMYPESKKEIRTVTFQVTEDCCLKCSYCYQTNKSRNKMTFDVAKKFVDDLLDGKYGLTTENVAGVIIEFIGGEPLMEIDLISQIVEYIITKMMEINHPWLPFTRFSIPSNGILLQTPKVIDFFDKYHEWCGYGVSIDGNKKLHDSCRVDFDNKGSYDRAISSVFFYRDRYNYMPQTKMTLAPENVMYTKDAILNLIALGYEDVHLNCQFEKGWTIEHARILYDQLKEVSDYIIEKELYDKIYLSIFDEDYFRPINPGEHDENWCGGVKDKMLAVDYKGDLFPCIRYMNSSLNGKQPPLILGNVNRGYLASDNDLNNLEKISNITRRSQSTDECYYCPIASGCAWCSAHNYQETGSVNCRLTHICIMHKARALANVYYWNKVYQHCGIDKTFVNYVKDVDIEQIVLPKGDNDNGRQFINQFKNN